MHQYDFTTLSPFEFSRPDSTLPRANDISVTSSMRRHIRRTNPFRGRMSRLADRGRILRLTIAPATVCSFTDSSDGFAENVFVCAKCLVTIRPG